MSTFLEALRERVLVFDGATGTNLQLAGITADDFGGPELEGCNELLNVTRPDVIENLHDSFFGVGCDAVETNTFGAFSTVLVEYAIPERAFELAPAGAHRARGRERPRGRRPAPVRDRLGRPRHEAAVARRDPLRRTARRVRGDGRR